MSALHELVEKKCGDAVAVGIHASLLATALKESVARLGAVPTTYPLPDRSDISFTVITAIVDQVSIFSPDNIVILGPVSVELNIHVAGDPTLSPSLAKMSLEFTDIKAKIVSIAGLTSFRVDSTTGPTSPAPIIEDKALRVTYFPTDREWYGTLYLLETNAGKLIPDSIVASIRLPDIASAAVAVRPMEPYQVSMVDDYVLVHGHNWLTTPSHEGCHKGPDAAKEVTTKITPPPPAGSPETAGIVEKFNGHVDLAFNKTAIPPVASWRDKPQAVLYIPKPALVDLSFGPLRLGWQQPPVKRHPFPFYYEYSAGASLKGLKLPEVELLAGALRIPVGVELDVFGELECGVQILCVKIVALGIDIETRNNDPIRLNFSLNVYFQDGKLMLYSEADPSTKVDFEMSGSFPTGLILVWLFEDLAETFLRNEVVSLLNSLRVTLFDFGKLGIAAGNAWEAIQSTRSDSVLLSAVEALGRPGPPTGPSPSPTPGTPTVPPLEPKPDPNSW